MKLLTTPRKRKLRLEMSEMMAMLEMLKLLEMSEIYKLLMKVIQIPNLYQNILRIWKNSKPKIWKIFLMKE